MTISSILLGAGLALLVLLFVSLPFRERLPLSSKVGRGQRLELMTQKAAVLAAIHEIDADAQVGKLEPADHRVLRQRYLEEGIKILKELDALPPGDEVDARIEADVVRFREQSGLVGAGVNVCSVCRGQVDPDDRFCAHCGARI